MPNTHGVCSAFLWSHGVGFSTFTPEEVDQPGGKNQRIHPKDLGYLNLQLLYLNFPEQISIIPKPGLRGFRVPNHTVDGSEIRLKSPVEGGR